MTAAPPPRRVTLLLGASVGGMGEHVRMLAAGFADRGIAVLVIGPASADARFSFSAQPRTAFSAAEIRERPRAGDLATTLRLRRLLLRPVPARAQTATPAGHQGAAPSGPQAAAPGGSPGAGGSPGGHVVHAHGLRAGAMTVLSLIRVAGERRPGIVVTVHNAPPAGGAAGLVYRLLERVVARGADLVLCVSPDLERRLRAARARHVERAVIAAPGPGGSRPSSHVTPASAASTPADAGHPPPDTPQALATAGRPVVLAATRLAPQKDLAALLEAAATWPDLDPVPLVVIAGDGPLAGELRAHAAALGVDARFLGHRDDVPALLAAAAVFVLPSRWEGQPLALQEALRAGTPVVATRTGGVPALTGEDAAVLVPQADVQALAAAVRSVLTDPALAARLRAAAAARAPALPTAADAVTAALDAYAAAGPSPGSP